MNFYKRHLGDYAKDTGHLSMLEHGAYGLLLDRYYGTEAPIPDAEKYRVTRARSKDEKDAVDVVLGEFFRLQDGVWHHKRCDEEIGKASHQREVNRELGLRGGRPRKTESVSSSITESVSDQRTESVSEREPIDNPSQTPDSRLQTPEKKTEQGSRLAKPFDLPDDWRQWAVGARPDLDPEELCEKFADYWHGVAGAKGRKADWPATWRNFVRSERAPPKLLNGKPSLDAWWSSADGIARKCREVGIAQPRPGESTDQVRGRINEAMSHAA